MEPAASWAMRLSESLAFSQSPSSALVSVGAIAGFAGAPLAPVLALAIALALLALVGQGLWGVGWTLVLR